VPRFYRRPVALFPLLGVNASEIFFARVGAKGARQFLGVAEPGRLMKTILLCVYVSLLAAAARGGKIHSGDADPYLTLVGYFTTILLAGFAVDHAADVLRPLHDSLQWSVSCRLFADADVAAEFLREH
jgi:hypothetical protein